MKPVFWILGILAAGLVALFLVFKFKSPTVPTGTAALATNTPGGKPLASSTQVPPGNSAGTYLAGSAAILSALGTVAKDVGVNFSN